MDNTSKEKTPNGTKRRMEKMPTGTKGRRKKNVDWDETSKSKKCRLEKGHKGDKWQKR